MTLCAFSDHLITKQWSFSNHGVQHSDLASFKQSGWHPTRIFPPTSEVFGKHLIQLLPRPKGKPTYPLVFATVHENGEPKTSGREPYKKSKLHKSAFLASENSASPESLGDNYVEEFPEAEDSKSLLSLPISRGIFEQPASREGNILDKLKGVLLHVLALEQWNASRLRKCHVNYLISATNLIHYVALESLDTQQLKEDLSSIGLLNLENVNSYVLPSISAGIQMLENLASNSLNSEENCSYIPLQVDVRDHVSIQKLPNHEQKEECTIRGMRKRAIFHAESLFGRLRDEKPLHIMVTVGREAIQNETLISDLLKVGANVIRINCAHDGPSVWSEIIREAKDSSQMLEKSCKILMDLAGPKLRTGPLKAGPNVMKISPKKGAKGDVLFPAQVWLSCTGCSPPAHLSPDAVLSLDDQKLLGKLEVGDVLRFFDARGKHRTLRISEKYPVFAGLGCLAECSRTCYVESGTQLYIKEKKRRVVIGKVVNVPEVEQFVRLRVGDLLVISRDPCLSSDEKDSSAIGAARITCSSGRLFDSVKPGEPIAFDDGKLWGVIQGASISEIIVSITHASPKGSKLGSEKSINIPQSEMQFEGLTSKDLVDLEFVAANADMVGISFVRDVRDVVMLQQELEKRKLRKLGIVLKIETRVGFERLPLLLLQAMQSPNPLGVMIARGDLAVECGWDRLADMQDEILSICNAAHIPAIWATQVLETLVKSGIPTRSEITDVAAGKRARCVMLNKGKHIVEAVTTLDSILRNNTKKNVKTALKPLVLSSHLNE